ncbi:MAG: hypothetical protein U0835_23200 [Isosphaeraceae bacterium]
MNGLIRAPATCAVANTAFASPWWGWGWSRAGSSRSTSCSRVPARHRQVLTFYGGARGESVEKDITNRMERWVGQASGNCPEESCSIVGRERGKATGLRSDVDLNGRVDSGEQPGPAAPNLPPGTPPVVLLFDPTSTTPVGIVVDSPDGSQGESILYDVGRYEVRTRSASINGAIALVVYGGKIPRYSPTSTARSWRPAASSPST